MTLHFFVCYGSSTTWGWPFFSEGFQKKTNKERNHSASLMLRHTQHEATSQQLHSLPFSPSLFAQETFGHLAQKGASSLVAQGGTFCFTERLGPQSGGPKRDLTNGCLCLRVSFLEATVNWEAKRCPTNHFAGYSFWDIPKLVWAL